MQQFIEKTIEFVKQELQHAEAGHDWWHIERVWKSAKAMAKEEDVDVLVVEFAALLHDIADAKFHDGDETVGPRTARAFLESENVDEETIIQVINILVQKDCL